MLVYTFTNVRVNTKYIYEYDQPKENKKFGFPYVPLKMLERV